MSKMPNDPRLILKPLIVTYKTTVGKGAYKITYGLEIKVSPGGKVSSTPINGKDARIDFFEVNTKKKPTDPTSAPRLLVSIPGKMVAPPAGKILFDADFNSVNKQEYYTKTPTIPGGPPSTITRKSDFFVVLETDKDTMVNTSLIDGQLLYLPWDAEPDNKLEIGVQLYIDGKLHSDIDDNGICDIGIQHKDVPDDGTSTLLSHTCRGVGNVYPIENQNVKPKQVLRKGKTLRIYLHKSIEHCLVSGSYNFAEITDNLTKVFQDVGFTSIDILEITSSDPKFSDLWHLIGKEYYAKKITTPTMPNKGEENTLDFFEFWVVSETLEAVDKKLSPRALAHSEAASIPAGGDKKNVVHPIVLLGDPKGELYTITKVKTPDSSNVLANVIAHEIGHTFGLYHALEFDYNSTPPSYTKSAPNNIGTMGSEAQSTLFNYDLKYFGPVHKKIIEDYFG